jgi:hypothetical protein
MHFSHPLCVGSIFMLQYAVPLPPPETFRAHSIPFVMRDRSTVHCSWACGADSVSQITVNNYQYVVHITPMKSEGLKHTMMEACSLSSASNLRIFHSRVKTAKAC